MATSDAGPEVDVEPEAVGFDAQRLACIDSHLRRYVDDGRLPGWSLVVSRRGQVAHVARYGHRDLEAGLPVELDTLFRIYSMTKPITSIAAMMLYEQGAFELTDPVSEYLPEFRAPQVFAGGSDLRPATVPATEPIRIWHLLTHTAGLTYGFHRTHPVDAMYRAADDGERSDTGLAGAVAAWAGLPLLFEPGTEWNYSVATDVVGRLVEVVSGRALDQFFAEEILSPLGMHDTTFRVDETQRQRLAALYVPGPGTGRATRDDLVGNDVFNPSWLSGGGGLVSTLGDYHRFTQFLRGRGRLGEVRLIGSRTLAFMATNQLPGGVDLATFGRPLFVERPFHGVGFGLGFSVTIDPVSAHGLESVGDFGWGGAASTAFWVDPVEDITAVFMTQLLSSSTYPIRAQLKQLVHAALVD